MRKFFAIIMVIWIFTMSTLFMSAWGETPNCAQMYSDKQGLYLVSDGKLDYNYYKLFWGENGQSNCYYWMIAWIWT